MGERIINFYRTNDPFGEFSNFAAFPIELKGLQWPTSEHYFQAQKFAGTKDEEEIRGAPSSMAAAKIAGLERSATAGPDWGEGKG